MKTELEKLIDKWESEKGSYIPNAPIYQCFIDDAKAALERQNKALRLGGVVGQSEQLVCETCGEVEVQEQGDWCDRCLGIDKEAN